MAMKMVYGALNFDSHALNSDRNQRISSRGIFSHFYGPGPDYHRIKFQFEDTLPEALFEHVSCFSVINQVPSFYLPPSLRFAFVCTF